MATKEYASLVVAATQQKHPHGTSSESSGGLCRDPDLTAALLGKGSVHLHTSHCITSRSADPLATMTVLL